jgi:hypothetical protein
MVAVSFFQQNFTFFLNKSWEIFGNLQFSPVNLNHFLVFGKFHQISGYDKIKNSNSVHDCHDFCSTNFEDFLVENLGMF